MSSRWVKQGLLLYWAVWTAIVFTANVTDALRTARLLPTSWAFASGNYSEMIKVSNIYHTPHWIIAWLFCGVIVWQAIGAWSYARAARSAGSPFEDSNVNLALAINVALWAAFTIADEVFLTYGIENTHRSIFAAQLLTLLVIWSLPAE
jgi:hypothetical protein